MEKKQPVFKVPPHILLNDGNFELDFLTKEEQFEYDKAQLRKVLWDAYIEAIKKGWKPGDPTNFKSKKNN